MKIRKYLVIVSQNGKCRLLNNPKGGFGEYVIRLDIEIPKPEIPIFNINIPLPAASGVILEAKDIQYGVPWALAEGVMEIKSVSPDGELKLDYTEEGLKRLYDESKPRPTEGWWGMSEYARKNWGLPDIYLEPSRWEPLFPPIDDKESK